MHWTATFEISSSGSSDTNHARLIVEYIYLHCMEHHVWEISFKQFRHKPRELIVDYYLHWTTTFEISFSGSSDTNHGNLVIVEYLYLHCMLKKTNYIHSSHLSFWKSCFSVKNINCISYTQKLVHDSIFIYSSGKTLLKMARHLWFANPMHANELYKVKLVSPFSHGN
jgi:hypothetical protein